MYYEPGKLNRRKESTSVNADAAAILALKGAPGMGNVSIQRLLHWSSQSEHPLTDLLSLERRNLLELLPDAFQQTIDALASCNKRHLKRARSLIKRVERAGGQAVTALDADYPPALGAALGRAAPPLLFICGDIALLHGPCGAVVGTRAPSDTGGGVAQSCAEWLVSKEACVVSGGARGIDSLAHRTALDSGGQTVVVLPEGMLSFRGDKQVVRETEAGRAALVSEFVPDAAWSTHGAITRNGTIAALSRLVCVIEAKATGGSVRTARAAIKQHKAVFMYAGAGSTETLEALKGKGASRLIPNGDGLDIAALEAAWSEAPRPRPTQAELF